MTKTQVFVLVIISLVAGVGLVVGGAVLSNATMIGFGGGLIGVFTGALGIPRPVDITTPTTTDTIPR
jgi:hypothetical protein